MTRTARVLLRLYAGGLGAAGLVLLFAPDVVGVTPPVVGQLVGAALLGFGAMTWAARGLALGGIYGRVVLTGNRTFATVGALVLLRHLVDAPSAWAGAGFGLLLIGVVLFEVLLRASPVGEREMKAD